MTISTAHIISHWFMDDRFKELYVVRQPSPSWFFMPGVILIGQECEARGVILIGSDLEHKAYPA